MARTLGIAVLLLTVGAFAVAQEPEREKGDGRPSIGLKATPLMAFSPARISLRAELKGGADDYEQYYCSTVEWEWGDGTVSERTLDCAPYEAGKSEIRRFYSGTHTYTISGRYNVRFKLKKGDKVVGVAVATVQVRPGIRDPSDPDIGG